MGPNPKLRRHRVLARTRSGGSGGDADLRPQTAGRRPQTADGTATAEAPAQTAAGQAASHQAHLARAPWDPATLRLRAPPEEEEDTHVYPKTRTRGITALPSAAARTAPALVR